MKRKLFAMLTVVMSVAALTGCTLPGGGSEKGGKEEKELEIEVSASKITLEEGESDEFEIENFDDLEKVKIEIEDDDIADADLDDDTVTVEGKEAGKTTITVSARDCEDVTVTVKVTEAENSDDKDDTPVTPTADGRDGRGELPAGGETVVQNKGLASEYVCYVPASDWGKMIDGSEDDPDTQDMVNFFLKCGVTLKVNFDLGDTSTNAGKGVMTLKMSETMQQVADALRADDDLYIELLELSLGETMDAETRQEALESKEYFIDALIETDASMDEVNEFDWSYDPAAGAITFSGDSSYPCPVDSDGSFTMAKDDISLTFVPVE